jgi:uncharacterized radical SAM superfamily Fe-S cluster-containing enzyme
LFIASSFPFHHLLLELLARGVNPAPHRSLGQAKDPATSTSFNSPSAASASGWRSFSGSRSMDKCSQVRAAIHARALDSGYAEGARADAMVARALASTGHPVLAQIVPARFCNLSCGYCNEYDKVSEPVPLEEMYRRIDHLGRLGTAMIGISGGEPLTHPHLDDIIRRMRRTGAIAGMITNGYLLNVERIERLNRAGLDHMQISIDNLEPDEVSKKSLKVLDKKLEMLAEYAEFHVNINSVVGGGFKNPNDALVIGRGRWSWALSRPSGSSTTAAGN